MVATARLQQDLGRGKKTGRGGKLHARLISRLRRGVEEYWYRSWQDGSSLFRLDGPFPSKEAAEGAAQEEADRLGLELTVTNERWNAFTKEHPCWC